MVQEQVRRTGLVVSAVVLALASMVPLLTATRKASAYNLATERAIKMSSSAVSASSTSYEVTFKAGTSSTVKSVAIDFCANTPIIDDSCTATVGTTTPTVASATVTTTGGVNNFSALTWTVAATNSNRTITLTNSTGVALTSGTQYTFTLGTITNPSTLGTFYARILTFPNDVTSDYADGYTATNVDTNLPTDAGGIALSTASQITITSKVQERLTFCVYTGVNCAAGGTAVTLGDANGVLDDTIEYVDKNAKYDIATNATFDATVRVKGTTLTNSASDTITAIGNTATSNAIGTEQFGFCTYQSTGSGLTPSSPYNNGSCSSTVQGSGGDGGAQFAFDDTATATTYGDDFAVKAAGSSSTGILAFIGNISAATEAGIYTTTLTFIATGSY